MVKNQKVLLGLMAIVSLSTADIYAAGISNLDVESAHSDSLEKMHIVYLEDQLSHCNFQVIRLNAELSKARKDLEQSEESLIKIEKKDRR